MHSSHYIQQNNDTIPRILNHDDLAKSDWDPHMLRYFSASLSVTVFCNFSCNHDLRTRPAQFCHCFTSNPCANPDCLSITRHECMNEGRLATTSPLPTDAHSFSLSSQYLSHLIIVKQNGKSSPCTVNAGMETVD